MSGYYSPTAAAFKEGQRLAEAALNESNERAFDVVAPSGLGRDQDWLGREARPLDSILAAAERVEDATGRLKGFVETFYGSLYPEPSEGDPGVCYNDHIKRLIAALDSLDVVIGKVREIG